MIAEITWKHSIGVVMVTLLASTVANAIVIRPDVADTRYRVREHSFPALVDLPGEGHGVLIARLWVVTAAHATQGYSLDHVDINGTRRDVAELIVHPDFRKLPEGPASGDAGSLMENLAAMTDIALIRLTQPVDDVTPVQRYQGWNEQGKLAQIYGKGATGNGTLGQYPKAPHRDALRRATNRIESAHAQWLDYRFDCDAHATALEGVMGDGDSGSPVLIREDGEWKLAGLADWKHWQGDLSTFRAGICGQTFSNSRISYYATWIDGVIRARSGNRRNHCSQVNRKWCRSSRLDGDPR
ncbi:MAG: trypsin-like serine protease [Dokdonella sp.]